jgi:hypothetical protein
VEETPYILAGTDYTKVKWEVHFKLPEDLPSIMQRNSKIRNAKKL